MLLTTRSIPYWTTSAFSSYCDWLGSDLRIGQFFSFRCPLVNAPQLNNELLNSLTTEWLNSRPNSPELNWTLESESEPYVTTDGQPASLSWNNLSNLSLSLTLRPTVSQPVCPGIKHPSGAYDQIFIIVWQLRVCWFGAPSLTRGRVCLLQLLLALASAVIFGTEFCRTRGHILLSQIRDFPFRRLLRLTGLRWRYSTSPQHGLSPFYNFEANRI
jgi:hypothetical protein